MQTLKKVILPLIIIGGLFFLLGPEVIPDNLYPQEILEKAKNSDIIIIFNSGGWGNTPLEKAEDFGPIIEEIQKTLNKWGSSQFKWVSAKISGENLPLSRITNQFVGHTYDWDAAAPEVISFLEDKILFYRDSQSAT